MLHSAIRILLTFLLILDAPLAALAQTCNAPIASDDGWQLADPISVGLDPATLCAIAPRLRAWPDASIHAVLVLRHGKLVYEQYLSGSNERFGRTVGTIDYNVTTLHDLRSITKSITSLVFGIEAAKGHAPAVDTPVLPLFPAYADLRSPERDRITIRDLLTMSQGLAWHEDVPFSDPTNSEIQMGRAPDPVRYALAAPIEHPPGAFWNYSAGSATILAALLRQSTEQPIDALARADLFEPLGITDFEWFHRPSGDPTAAAGLRLRPRDLAKVGQLVLDHGVWHGQQVVPADWIAAVTSPQVNGPDLYFYGYQFWLGRSLVRGTQIDWSAAEGFGGQRVFIVPSLDMVVVILAGLYNGDLQYSVPLLMLNHFILGAVSR